MSYKNRAAAFRVAYPGAAIKLKTTVFLLTLIAALALCIPAFAQSSPLPPTQPLVLVDEQGQYSLGRHMAILEDPSGELTITDVTSPEYSSRFVPSQQDVPVYGYTVFI